MTDPIPTETLPGVEPNLTGLGYIDIIPDKYTYALTTDNYTFGLWAERVSQIETYIVTEIDTTNAYRFSSFIISHQCITEEVGDGCCMIEEEFGGVCLIRQSDP